MSHRFLPLLIVTWTCWLSLPENAQARSHSFDPASNSTSGSISDFVALAQPQLLAQEEAGSSLLDEPALDTERENGDETGTGSSLLDSPDAETPRALMQVGSEGPGVEAVQRKLAELGYFSGSADGVYGATTGEAVQQFQEANGLTVTGQIDLRTWERIQTSTQSLVTESSGSDSSSSASPSTDEAAAAPSTDAANAEVGTNSEQPTNADSNPENPNPANWTLKRILLVGGIAVFGLVAIAGMSLSVWKWLIKRSAQSSQPSNRPFSTGTAVTDRASPNAGAFHAINTTATPIENGLQPSPTTIARGFGSSMPSAYADQTEESFAEDSRLHPAPATNTVNPAAPANHHEDASNGSAQLQPPNVSPTTRLSKTNLMESLIHDLDSIDPTIRRKAIWQLGQQGTNQAIQPLVNLMIDSDSQQRSLILAALSEIGQRTLNPMHRALAMSLQDENAEVRKNAIRDLTRIYDQVAQLAPLLRHAMEDADPTVRDTAAWALNQLNRQVKQASFQPNSSPAQLNQSSAQPDDIWQDS